MITLITEDSADEPDFQSSTATLIHDNPVVVITDDIENDDPDDDEQNEPLRNKRKRSPSSGATSVSSVARKRSRSSVYENAAQIAAEGIMSLGTKVVEAQQILALSLESQFIQYIRILTKMKIDGFISGQDYFEICQKFRTDKETYSEMFMGMITTEHRLEWLTFEGLLNS